jgi:hypothetical protein
LGELDRRNSSGIRRGTHSARDVSAAKIFYEQLGEDKLLPTSINGMR